MDTPYTLRAQQLRDIYNTITLKGLSRDERLDALLTLKSTVKVGGGGGGEGKEEEGEEEEEEEEEGRKRRGGGGGRRRRGRRGGGGGGGGEGPRDNT